MTNETLIEIIKMCRDHGVSFIKIPDLELKFDGAVVPKNHKPDIPKEIADQELPDEIKHKVEEFTSVMKLGDADLVDRLFPLPTEEADS